MGQRGERERGGEREREGGEREREVEEERGKRRVVRSWTRRRRKSWGGRGKEGRG